MPGSVSATLSTVSVTNTSVVANGITPLTATVTLRDVTGNPLPSISVSASVSGGGVNVTPSAVTNSAGQATFQLSSTQAGSKVFAAQAGGIALARTATVMFTPDTPSAATSTFTAAPSALPADNSFASAVRLILRDSHSNPVPGVMITFVGSAAHPPSARRAE